MNEFRIQCGHSSFINIFLSDNNRRKLQAQFYFTGLIGKMEGPQRDCGCRSFGESSMCDRARECW